VIVDTSALVAILLREPLADRLVAALQREPDRRISTASLLEAGMVMQARLGDNGERELDLLVRQLGIVAIPFTPDHVELARSAFRRFGKGRHPAGLNFGDCFSYALAQALGEPLLFVGADFARTDLPAVPY
jgi:ribonuclease VapC